MLISSMELLDVENDDRNGWPNDRFFIIAFMRIFDFNKLKKLIKILKILILFSFDILRDIVNVSVNICIQKKV